MHLSAQEQTLIQFAASYGDQKFNLSQSYFMEDKQDSIQFHRIRYYVSDIHCYQGGQLVYRPTKNHHLIDFENVSSTIISCDTIFAMDSISFILGVDSLTNMQGAHGDDLDPIHGMYWVWNSGYINFKLEGQSKQCPTRKNKFQYHIGGFLAPHKAERKINLGPLTTERLITLDIKSLLSKIDLSSLHTIMSPSDKTMLFADHIVEAFKILD